MKGQRQPKVLNFLVEWYNLEHISLIQLHLLTTRSPPLHHQSAGSEVPPDSFPPGEAKGQLRKLFPLNYPLNSIRFRADAIRPYGLGVAKYPSALARISLERLNWSSCMASRQQTRRLSEISSGWHWTV